MATYYVKNGGNDSATGLDDTNAWAHAPGQAGWTGSVTPGAGDSVLFKRGDTWTNQALIPLYSGTVGNQITFGAYGSGVLPILDGNGGDYSTGLISLIAGQDYLTFEYLEIRNVGKSLFVIRGNAGTVQGIRLQNCTIHDNNTAGYELIAVAGIAGNGTATAIKILNNLIYDCTWNAIKINRGATYVEVANNTIHTCQHNGIDTLGDGSYYSAYLDIHDNDIYNIALSTSGGAGIYTPGLNDSEIYENDIHDCPNLTYGQNGIKCGQQAIPCNRITVRNNRIWKLAGVHANSNALWFDHNTDSNVWNNTVYNCYRTMMDDGTNTALSNENNLAYACTNGTASLANYGSDPKFIDPTGTPPDFHLQFNSPVIDQGVDVGLPYNDTAPDLGAYECFIGLSWSFSTRLRFT